ncbi:MAG TPA: TolC family protein, partial [bacterium]|nr:TolC family protein [bacterium]
ASVKKVFYQVLLARQVYETTKASLINAENNFNNVRILNKQGIVSDYDMIRAEVQVENLRPSVISAEQQALVVTNALKVQLGMDATDPLHIRGELTPVPIDSSWLDEQRAVTQNAGLEALRLQQDLNAAVSSIRLAEYMPTLAAFGTYQWQAQKNTMDFGGKDFISTSQVGFTLSLNLFNGFQTTARLAQSRADERKAEQQLRYTRENIRSQMQSIRLRLDEARKRMASQNRTVELAEKSYKIATTRYATGSGTQLEVNDADVALLQARLNRIHAIYDYLVTCVDLEEMISYHQPQN